MNMYEYVNHSLPSMLPDGIAICHTATVICSTKGLIMNFYASFLKSICSNFTFQTDLEPAIIRSLPKQVQQKQKTFSWAVLPRVPSVPLESEYTGCSICNIKHSQK